MNTAQRLTRQAMAQVPLTAVMLLFELTHDYFIIPPTLGAVGLAYWVASLPDTTQLLARLLPGGPAAADEQAAAPPIPWQSVADAQSMSRQLGMQVSERQGREVRLAPLRPAEAVELSL